jgi:hypothetical protein
MENPILGRMTSVAILSPLSIAAALRARASIIPDAFRLGR